MAALEVNRTDRVAQPRMERPQPEPLTPSSSRPVPPTVISNEAGRLFLPHPTCPRTVISNEAGRLFLPHPTCPRTVISNEAGRLFLPHSLLRMRRPAQREISLLFAPCTRPRPAHPHHLMKKNHHEEKKRPNQNGRPTCAESTTCPSGTAPSPANTSHAIELKPSLTPGTPISDWRLEHERVSRSSHRTSLSISPTNNPSTRPCTARFTPPKGLSAARADTPDEHGKGKPKPHPLKNQTPKGAPPNSKSCPTQITLHTGVASEIDSVRCVFLPSLEIGQSEWSRRCETSPSL